MKKPRADSVLKTLHPKKQQELWDFLFGHKLSEGIDFVKKEFGVDTSETALSGWRHWYPYSDKLTEWNDRVKAIVERLKAEPELDLDSDKVSKVSHAIFEVMAADTEDPKLFIELRKLRQADQKQATQLRRLEAIEQTAKNAKDKLTAVVTRGGISKEAIKEIERVAKILA